MASRQGTGSGKTAKSAGDATGKKQASLEAEVVEDQKRSQELSMISRQEEEAEKDEVKDLTTTKTSKPESRKTAAEKRAEAEIVDEGGSTHDMNEVIESLRQSDDPALRALAEDYERIRLSEASNTVDQGIVHADDPTRIIRTNADIGNMTLGVGTNYSFKAGQKYRVPKHVAEHLAEKDLLML